MLEALDIPNAVRGASEGNLSRDLDDVVGFMNAAKSTFGNPPGEGFPERSSAGR